MEQEQSSKFLVPGAIVVAGALVAGAIYMGGGTLPSSSTASASQAATIEIPAVTTEDHILGDINAPVVAVEYSDTECPFCKAFHQTMRQIYADYKGQVAWVYRQFPIAQLHSKAPNEAAATECVASIGGNAAFWSYLNSIFDTTTSNDSLDSAELPRLASAVGIDNASFTSCLASGRFDSKVQHSVEEAIKIGARGTPYTVLIAKDGQKVVVNGAEPYDSVKAKIDSLLK